MSFFETYNIFLKIYYSAFEMICIFTNHYFLLQLISISCNISTLLIFTVCTERIGRRHFCKIYYFFVPFATTAVWCKDWWNFIHWFVSFWLGTLRRRCPKYLIFGKFRYFQDQAWYINSLGRWGQLYVQYHRGERNFVKRAYWHTLLFI